MTPDIAMELVWDWGFVFIAACIVIGFGLTFIRDVFKNDV
jgi:hypothetical protein